MIRIARSTLLLAAAAALQACGGTPAATEPPTARALEATNWQVEDIDGGGIVDRSMITLMFDDESRLAGSTGCNRFVGSVALDGGRFELSGAGSTRRACAVSLMEQEQRFLAALEESVRWDIEADTWLVLFDDGGNRRLKAIETARNAIAGAAAQDRGTGSTRIYDCGDGGTVEFRFAGPETVEIAYGGSQRTLQRIRSASGARYAGDGAEFWIRGNEAMFVVDGSRHQCVFSAI